jgi:hypothetical protein
MDQNPRTFQGSPGRTFSPGYSRFSRGRGNPDNWTQGWIHLSSRSWQPRQREHQYWLPISLPDIGSTLQQWWPHQTGCYAPRCMDAITGSATWELSIPGSENGSQNISGLRQAVSAKRSPPSGLRQAVSAKRSPPSGLRQAVSANELNLLEINLFFYEQI